MTAHQSRARLVQSLEGALQGLRQGLRHLFLTAVGDDGDGQGGLRRRAHGVQIAQGVICRHLAEQVGVVHERGEKIHRVQHDLASGDGDRGGIVPFAQTEQHIGPGRRVKPRQGLL